MSLDKYQKMSITLKSYLKGKGFHKALEAFEFAKQHHTGTRKDKVTPEFQHQIEICLFITTLKEVMFEEDCLVVALLHDVREDYNISHDEIEKRFGKRVADAVEKLTKEYRGAKKDPIQYFMDIANCPIASIVKLADRINNVNSMVGVFTIKAQEKYLFEIEEYFLPMLKKARNLFPEQLSSYHSMNFTLKNTTSLIKNILGHEKKLVDAVETEKAPERILKPV